MAKTRFSTPVLNIEKVNQKGYVFQKKASLDFSLSENPMESFPKGVKSAIIKSINQLNTYPTLEKEELKTILAKNFSLKKESVALGNGLEQIIDNVVRVLIDPNDEVIIPCPAFFLFEKAALLSRAKIVFIKPNKNISLNLDACQKKAGPKTKLIILSNPNNPTGQLIAKKKLIAFIKKVSPVIVLVDEANIEFSNTGLIKEVKKIKNLIILRTFSKAFGLAGLRTGFAVANPQLIKAIENITQPVPINILACAAITKALKDTTFLKKTKAFTKKECLFLVKSLKNLGITVFPSQANNILIQTDFAKFNSFLKRNNVSVVDASCFKGLNKGFFRISPRSEKKNKKLISLLQKDYK